MDVGQENDTPGIPFSVKIMQTKCYVTFIYMKRRGVLVLYNIHMLNIAAVAVRGPNVKAEVFTFIICIKTLA